VCAPDDPGDGSTGYRAYAFQNDGSSMPGWPLQIGPGIADRPIVLDGQLIIVRNGPSQSVASSTAYWIEVIDPDGSVTVGRQFDPPSGQPESGGVQLSPRGIGFHMGYTAKGTEITAFGLEGVRKGWPIRLDGFWSAPALDIAGRLYVASEPARSVTRILGFESDGRTSAGDFRIPAVAATSWQGAGPGDPALVTSLEGGVFVLARVDGRATVFGFDRSGVPLPGWPYSADGDLATQGTCSGPDTGCGVWLVEPGFDPGPELEPRPVFYLPVAARDSASGGVLTAIGVNGRVRSGWPVTLQQAGAVFWSVVVGVRGYVFAVAIEPEPSGSSSTVLSIGAGGTVRYRATVVDSER
jgi:hypothetical protein